MTCFVRLHEPLAGKSLAAPSHLRGARTKARFAVSILVGALLAVGPAAPGTAANEPSPVATKSDPYAEFIAEAAQRFELPERWIRAVLAKERAADPHVVSPEGAMGLMQIMPKTWNDLRGWHRLGTDPFDPHDNIIAGTAYLRQLYDRYGSPGFMAAYDAVPRRDKNEGSPDKLRPAETARDITPLKSPLDDTDIATPATSAQQPWSSAPLFIGGATAKSTTEPKQPDRRFDDIPPTSQVHDLSAIAPQPGGLFVARPTAGWTP